MKLVIASNAQQFELVRRELGLEPREVRNVRFPYDIRGASVESIVVAEPCLVTPGERLRYWRLLEELERIEGRAGVRAQRVRT